MIKFVPFEPEHIDQLRLRPDFEAQASILALAHGASMVKRLANSGNALTIVGRDEEVLAVVLWFSPAPGLIDIGMFAAEGIYSQPCSYLRFARRKFKEFLATLTSENTRRIQTMSFVDPKHDRWMEWLGFTCEGTFKKYAHNGADMRVWAITEV